MTACVHAKPHPSRCGSRRDLKDANAVALRRTNDAVPRPQLPAGDRYTDRSVLPECELSHGKVSKTAAAATERAAPTGKTPPHVSEASVRAITLRGLRSPRVDCFLRAKIQSFAASRS
ncbi:hypothetical protein AzCIB_0210 [Azoarcus sp. CIB]|nr:hypothetical protein AzCIB_0210 [Azoarcus sp. CIB]